MNFLISFFVLWRLGLFFVAWVGEKFLTFSPRFPYSEIYLKSSGLPDWIWSFANFDGVHYLTIALKGYSSQFTQAFFPLYPMLLGLTYQIFNFISPVLIGLIISNLFFLFSLIIFYKLLLLDYKENTVRWVLAFTLFFPTSFYFGSVYTESLFLFLIISSFFAARKDKWIVSSVLGLLATATKLTGVFLLPALWWEWHKRNSQSSFFEAIRSPLWLIPVGLLSYMLYLQVNFGDWLYFWHAQPIFGAERSGSGLIFLPQVLWRYGKILSNIPPSREIYWISSLELISTLFTLVILYFSSLKRIRLSYIIFSILAVITPTLTGTLSSMPRYVLLAFPVFIVLAMIKSKLAKSIILVFFIVLLIILTILFTRGHWVG